MPLLLRALRWRAAASVATALLAAVTVLGAVVGPLWTRAGTESILRDTLVAAGRTQNAAVFESRTVPGAQALAFVQDAAESAALPHYGKPIAGISVISDTFIPGGTLRLRQQLLWREGFCEQVIVLSGRCPRAAGEVMLHRITAQRLSARVGDDVKAVVKGFAFAAPVQPAPEVMVGSYVPKDARAAYWAGDGETAFLSYLGGTNGLSELPDRVPATLTVPETFYELAPRSDPGNQLNGYLSVTRLLDVDSVRLADVPALRRAVERESVAAVEASVNQVTTVTLVANVVFQLDTAEEDGDDLGRASTIVLAQLMLLSGVVLVLVLSAAGAARAPEIAAARLRGLRTRTVVQLALGEPVALVLLGTPVGALGGLLVVQAMAAARLRDGTPVQIGTGAVEALLLALVALLLAVALVCGRALGTPVLKLWQRTDRPPSGFALAAELLSAVVLGVLGWVCTRSGQPWELLTPVPVALAVALLGLRLLPLLFLPAVRRTRARRRVAAFLAVRQLVRRREGSWLTGLLVVAFGLAATATASWSVATGAAETRARAEVGAAVVYQVQPDLQHRDLDLRAAVRAADPSGRKAMAVLEYLPFANDPGGRYLAVDTDRLAAVALWDDAVQGASLDDVVAALRVPSGEFPSAVVTTAVAQDPVSIRVARLPQDGAVITTVTAVPQTVIMRKVVTALPRSLAKGTMTDIGAVQGVDNDSVAALFEVWATSADPALRKALERQGLQVLATDDARDRQAVLSRQGPGLAVLLSLVAAGIALVLAAATTLFSALTSGRRRGWELAALSALGVPERTLRRSSRRESLLLLGVGLGLGLVAGLIACVATLRSIPYFSDETTVRLSLRPDPGPLAVLLGIAVVLVVLTSSLVGRALHRASDPARLREVQA